MADFNVFRGGPVFQQLDLAQAYADAERVLGMRQDREWQQRRLAQLDAASEQERLQQTQLAEMQREYSELMASRNNPAWRSEVAREIKEADPRLASRSDDEVLDLAEQQLRLQLGIEAEKPEKENIPNDVLLAKYAGVDINNPEAVRKWFAEEDRRKLERAQAGKSDVNVTLPGAFKEDTAAQEFSRLVGQQFAGVLDAGRNAQDELAVWQTIKTNPAVTGPTQDFRASLQSLAADLGIPVSESQLAQITDLGQYRAAANDLVLQKQLAQKGPQTESDARRMEKAVANTKNLREVNDLIVRYSIELLNRKVDRAAFYDEHRQRTNKLDGAEAGWREYTRQTPLAKRNKSGRMIFQSEFMDAARARGMNDDQARAAWRAYREGT